MESRVLKFRAWGVGEKEWRTDLNFYIDSNNGKVVFISGVASNGLEIMQFTGLKDKNGKEIFEGDICIYIDDGDKKKGFVRFDGGRFEIGKHNGYGGDWNDLGMLLHSYWNNKEAQNSFEVIGNVYENKELLENEDE